MSLRPFYYQETKGLRITVRPSFRPDQSMPSRGTYVFAYHVRIENVSSSIWQLLTRHWHIVDSAGEEHRVAGEGVVGEQPLLGVGDVYEYQSFCVLKSSSGHMEGHYHFVGKDGSTLDAQIPRFYLTTEVAEWPDIKFGNG